MDLTRRKRKEVAVTVSDLQLYPHDLQLYLLPPVQAISLTEFENLAVDRLKALRIVENVSLKGLKSLEDAKNATIAEMIKQGLKYFAKLIQGSGSGKTDADVQARRKDHISHFILRLAYCRTEELRRWFVKQEIELFRMRFLALSSDGIKSLLAWNKLDYNPISSDEKREIRDRLYDSTHMLSPLQIDTTDFFRVPFTEVLNLVSKRKCLVSKGFAYIPSSDLFSVVLSIFKANLSGALARTSRLLPKLGEDERLSGLLKRLHTSFTGRDDFVVPKTEISISNLDSLSRVSYPPCMRQLHESLRTNHHLRHGGRQQYGLFLKGIGVTLQDALQFWRDEFTAKMDHDQFEKRYSYNIRHNFGKEGKQVNYTPYSCLKIIMSSVGNGDSHGCPFKHNDSATLKQQLAGWSVSPTGISEISKYVTEGHYQLACGKYFELSNGALPDRGGINHPNQYFEDSQKIHYQKKWPEKSSGPANAAKLAAPAHIPHDQKTDDPDMMWEDLDFPDDDFVELDGGVIILQRNHHE